MTLAIEQPRISERLNKAGLYSPWDEVEYDIEKAPIETKIPILSYYQLFGKNEDEAKIVTGMKHRRRYRSVRLDESYIWAFGGPRGSGKSESLDYLGVKAIAADLPTWTNFPIKFTYLDPWDRAMVLESKPLYFKDIFKLSPDLRGGWILIDEYQDWDNALMFMSTQSRLIHAFWAQIRKNDLSFGYGSKKLKWIGYKTREETDIDIMCHDSYYSSGFGKYQKGEMIYWTIMDLSGMFTGKPYEEWGTTKSMKLYARMLWGSYDTKLRFDVFEALKGVKLNLQKESIGDARNEPLDYEMVEHVVDQVFSNREKVQPGDLKAALGITSTLRWAEVKQLLPNLGVVAAGTIGRPYFVRERVVT